IAAKLIPLGLIATQDESIPYRDETAGDGRARSPLAVNMRTKALPPRVIDPITRVLQIFFAPPLLIPVFIAIVIAHGWLYRAHGLEASIRDVLMTPGGLLLTLALLILAGMFHEFGHASALRYGGGQVRGIGAGFYLMYPAFYTD